MIDGSLIKAAAIAAACLLLNCFDGMQIG